MSVRSDATTDILTYTGTLPAVATTGITLCFWAYISSDRNDYSTFARVDAGGSLASIETDADGTTLWSFGAAGSINSGVSMTAAAWYRVALTVSTAGVASLYLATAAGSTGVTTGTHGTGTGTSVTLMGRADDSAQWANGRIAYARMWSTVLTQTQIEAEWASASAVVTSGLFADWPLTVHTDLTDHSGNGRNLTAGSTAVTTEADPPLTSGTNAPAGVAAGTGAARTPTALVVPALAAAAGTGLARTPTAPVAPTLSAATGTGLARTLTVTTAASPAAGLAAGTGAALAPTVSVTSSTNAAAGVAAGVGTASAPTPALGVPAGAAAGTGAALAPSVTGSQPAPAGLATGTGAAGSPTVTVQAPVGLAAGTGAAWQPTVNADGSTSAPAGVATGTGAALSPTLSTTATVTAGNASGTGAALAPTVTAGAAAGAAAGTGSAPTPGVAVGVWAGRAVGTGTAQTPTATAASPGDAIAGRAAGIGSAHTPTVQALSVAAQTGSWRSLIVILAEARNPTYRQLESQFCPNDGVTYQTGRHGELYCPFDGYRPTHAAQR